MPITGQLLPGIRQLPTGFDVAGNNIGSGGNTIIYVAIRRPNMATITDATKVFNTTTGLGANPQWKPGFTVDFELYRRRTGTQLFHAGARLTGTNYLRTSGTDAQDCGNVPKVFLMWCVGMVLVVVLPKPLAIHLALHQSQLL